jgi:hypothetical protein
MEFRCPKCRLIYGRDLNACINMAHALTRGMGWGRREPQLANEEIKPTLNAGSLDPQVWVAHMERSGRNALAKKIMFGAGFGSSFSLS